MSNLIKLLKSDKKIFKLVCGAGNECADEVEKLVCLYADAGCQYFDISASLDILNATKKGLNRAQNKHQSFINVSVGIKGDPHISKANIDLSKCQHCRRCEFVCENNAINDFIVSNEKCLGCGKCYKLCPANAINITSVEKDLKVVLPELVKNGIDSIEFHATVEDDSGIIDKWMIINDCFDGVLSICIDRSNLGNKQVLSRIKKMLEVRKPFTTIIQADGIPMSGSDDTYKTTLQTVAMAEIIQDAKLPVFLFLSGGTNTKTVELADLCKISYTGVAVGSYARKIVKPFINRKDFFTNKTVYDEALALAKRLVNTVN